MRLNLKKSIAALGVAGLLSIGATVALPSPASAASTDYKSSAISSMATGFTTPCAYQTYKGGATLMDEFGYDLSTLRAAAEEADSMPPRLTNQQLRNNVLYRCIDTNGSIIANSFCIIGVVTLVEINDNEFCIL